MIKFSANGLNDINFYLQNICYSYKTAFLIEHN